jgi:hypothetical protein
MQHELRTSHSGRVATSGLEQVPGGHQQSASEAGKTTFPRVILHLVCATRCQPRCISAPRSTVLRCVLHSFRNAPRYSPPNVAGDPRLWLGVHRWHRLTRRVWIPAGGSLSSSASPLSPRLWSSFPTTAASTTVQSSVLAPQSCLRPRLVRDAPPLLPHTWRHRTYVVAAVRDPPPGSAE